jgi:hypothetical protein
MSLHALAMCLLTIAALSSDVRAEIAVTPVKLRETRTQNLTPPGQKPPQFFMGSDMTITLKLSGPEMKDATEYRPPQVTAATDDTGASLIEKNLSGGNMFQTIQRMEFGFDEKGKKTEPSTDVDVDVQLKLPARTAKKLALVKGTIALRAGGEKKTVTVKNPKLLFGKPIEDPALAAANLKVKVLDPKTARGFGGANTLGLEVTGDLTPLKSIDVLDAAGKKVNFGHSSFGANNVSTYQVDLQQPLDEKMTLNLNLVIGQKVIDVPFELKDVALP